MCVHPKVEQLARKQSRHEIEISETQKNAHDDDAVENVSSRDSQETHTAYMSIEKHTSEDLEAIVKFFKSERK